MMGGGACAVLADRICHTRVRTSDWRGGHAHMGETSDRPGRVNTPQGRDIRSAWGYPPRIEASDWPGQRKRPHRPSSAPLSLRFTNCGGRERLNVGSRRGYHAMEGTMTAQRFIHVTIQKSKCSSICRDRGCVDDGWGRLRCPGGGTHTRWRHPIGVGVCTYGRGIRWAWGYAPRIEASDWPGQRKRPRTTSSTPLSLQISNRLFF